MLSSSITEDEIHFKYYCIKPPHIYICMHYNSLMKSRHPLLALALLLHELPDKCHLVSTVWVISLSRCCNQWNTIQCMYTYTVMICHIVRIDSNATNKFKLKYTVYKTLSVTALSKCWSLRIFKEDTTIINEMLFSLICIKQTICARKWDESTSVTQHYVLLQRNNVAIGKNEVLLNDRKWPSVSLLVWKALYWFKSLPNCPLLDWFGCAFHC